MHSLPHQACTTAYVTSAKYPPRGCLATGLRPLLPVVLTQSPRSTQKGWGEGAELRTCSPCAPGRQHRGLINILPKAHISAAATQTEENLNAPHSPSPLGLRNQEREALQRVLVAKDSGGGLVCAGRHQNSWPCSGHHHALHGLKGGAQAIGPRWAEGQTALHSVVNELSCVATQSLPT